MIIAGREYTTYAEAEANLGVSRPTLNRLVARGVIEAYRPGKKTLLAVESLHEWFLSTQIRPRRRPGRPRNNQPRRQA